MTGAEWAASRNPSAMLGLLQHASPKAPARQLRLDHCRGDGPHVRGCWVVDLVLGKG